MWYIKSDLEAVEAIRLETEYDICLPYFKRIRQKENTSLQLVDSKFIRLNGNCLLLNPSIATWCFINNKEIQICRSLLQPTNFSYLSKNFQNYNPKRMKRFLTHLYRLGFLKVNNKTGIDNDILKNGPLYRKSYLIEILMTEKCNLACEYCFTNASPNRATMPLDIGYLSIEKAMELPCKSLVIEFGGGETYLEFKNFFEMVKYTKKIAARKSKEVQIVAQSNGTMFTKHQILRFIDRHKIYPSISLDGPPEINDKIRHFADGRGITDLLIKNIKRLRWYGYKSAPVLTVVGKHNVEQPEKVVDFLTSLGLCQGMFNPILALGKAKKNWNELGVSPKKYFQFMKRALEYSSAKRNLFKDLTSLRLMGNLIRRTRDFRCMRSPCGAGFDYIVISPNGDIYPCSHHADKPELKMGNIKDTDPLNMYIFRNPLVAEMKLYRIVNNIPECQKCIWRHFCEGGCSLDTYFQYNTLYHPSPLCEFFKLIYPFLFDFIFHHPEVIKNYLPEACVVSY